MSSRDWSLLLFLSLLWGGSFFFARVALIDLPPLTLVLARVVIAAVALGLYIRVTVRVITTSRTVVITCLGMGLLNNVIPFSLIFWGQTVLPAGLTAILNATTPLFSVIVMHLMTRDERATPNKVAGVLLGFTGVIILIAPSISGLGATPLWAMLVCLAGAVSYAFSGLYGRRFKALGLDPAVAAFGQITASSLLMVPLVALVDSPWTLAMPGMPAILATIALAVVSTALAYVVFFTILESAGPTNLLLVTFLIPVSAIALGWVLLGEQLAWYHFAGMLLIGAGLAAIDGRITARLFTR
ncbi:MAG: DMT family transporter [Alphaproteobacteria bacterium]